MATFVLVHGAYHGGWCWRKVTPLLRAAGHEAYAPTLTGLGERVHLATPEVGLDTHVQDVCNLLEYEDLSGVVLVGHSYGGHVIAGVADQAPERLAHLVYLDADSGVYAADGRSYNDVRNAARRARGEEPVRPRGDVDWRAFVERGLDGWGIVDPAERRWMAERLVPQPGTTARDPLRLPSGRGQALPRTFILCTRGPWRSTTHLHPAQSAPGWRFRELDTGHDAMVTAPRELTDLLLEVAAAP